MTYEIQVNGLNKVFDIERKEKGYLISHDGRDFFVEKTDLSNSIHMILDGKSYELGVAKHSDHWEIGVEGERFLLNVVDPRKKSLRIASGEGEGLLITKMPGRVVEVCCEVGQTVEKGDVIIIVEAMKMENPLKAAKAGTISEIFVGKGDLVEAKQKLILID
jgi:biotin carboxyl carrier protein